MRRIVRSLGVVGVLALGACSGGGSVLNFNSSATPDRVIVTVVGPTNLARVLPGAGLPLTAVAVQGSQNGFINSNRFRWSAALTTGMTYNFTSDGNQQRACATVTITQSGTVVPYTADFGIYIAIDPTNESNIEFIPPTIIPTPVGASALTPAYPYCVVVTATPIGGGAQNSGSITVVVVSPTAPLG
jgi:hypothetical protein